MATHKTVVFLFRTYNDVDSIVPVVWKMLVNGDRPICIFTHGYDHVNDYRFAYLRSRFDFTVLDIEPISDRQLIWLQRIERLPGLKGRLPDRLWSKSGISVTRFLIEENVTACAYEHGPPGGRSAIGLRFMQAAKRLGIPTFCLPHGMNTFLGHDVNFGTRKQIRETGKLPDLSDRNAYDCVVLNSPRFMEKCIAEGISPKVAQCWGSPRFDPAWAALNLSICPPFVPQKECHGRVKVVFMVPHWEYNVDQDATRAMLRRLAAEPWIYLVVKGHTRGEELFDDERARLENMANVEMASHAHSSALIAWSDAVINMASSIGVEALLQDKTLLYARYLHDNRTIYDQHGAGHMVDSDDDMLAMLKALRDGNLADPSQTAKDALLRDVVFGGQAPHDVPESYWRHLTGRDHEASRT